MSTLRHATPVDPYGRILAVYGFVPNLFRAQSALPRAVESEAQLIEAVLVNDGALSRRQKDGLLLAVAAAGKNVYCAALFGRSGGVLSCPGAQFGKN